MGLAQRSNISAAWVLAKVRFKNYQYNPIFEGRLFKMSQLYQLKNGSIGHYCDVYQESAIEELSKMPIFKLTSYISELIEKPSHFGNDVERLDKALKTITSIGSSISVLNKSLEVIADVEYHRVFSSDENVSKPARDLIRKFRGKY